MSPPAEVSSRGRLQKIRWANEDLAAPSIKEPLTSSLNPTYCARREHSKSRKGCQICKQRRKKCDERKPKCSRCFDLRLQCQYSSGSRNSEKISKTLQHELISFPKPQALAQAQILACLRDDEGASVAIPTDYYSVLEILEHFEETNTPWIGSPECQKIMQRDGIQMALGAPYLLHAILAFSASHLSYLHSSMNKYAVAAAVHYEKSLKLYSSELHCLSNRSNPDAIYACCHLHSMLAFRNIHLTSMEGPSGSTNNYRHGWLRAMQGTGVLRHHSSLQAEPDRGIWDSVCVEARANEKFICVHTSIDNAISAALHKICESTLDSTIHENPYKEPLSRLCHLMRLNISDREIGMFMVFLGKLPTSFVQLLDENDPRAMLIMAHWCFLLGRIDQWWVVESARLECARFCRHLNNLSDSRILELLPLHPEDFVEL